MVEIAYLLKSDIGMSYYNSNLQIRVYLAQFQVEWIKLLCLYGDI